MGNRQLRSIEPFDLPTYQAYRVSLLQQVNTGARYKNVNYGQLPMIGVQVDAIINDHWYIPIQASIAYKAYMGYPGYGELLAGIGLQSRATPGENLQFFGQLMGGTNVHGLATKANVGFRYKMTEQMSVQLAAGRIEARDATGKSFRANNLSVGLDYLFSIPGG